MEMNLNDQTEMRYESGRVTSSTGLGYLLRCENIGNLTVEIASSPLITSELSPHPSVPPRSDLGLIEPGLKWARHPCAGRESPQWKPAQLLRHCMHEPITSS